MFFVLFAEVEPIQYLLCSIKPISVALFGQLSDVSCKLLINSVLRQLFYWTGLDHTKIDWHVNYAKHHITDVMLDLFRLYKRLFPHFIICFKIQIKCIFSLLEIICYREHKILQLDLTHFRKRSSKPWHVGLKGVGESGARWMCGYVGPPLISLQCHKQFCHD